MYKYVKGALIFTGGVAVGIGVAGGLALSSRDIRKLLAHKLADVLLGECEQVHYVEDILFDEREKAESALVNMKRVIDEYGKLTVEDYKDLCGITPSYLDSKYGWISLGNVNISKDRNGFVLELPRVIELK